jgi:glycine dehydrogenase subunit 2
VLNRQGRPTTGGASEKTVTQTISGHRGLDHEEKLIFEIGRSGVSGVDLPDIDLPPDRLGGLERKGSIGLPGLSEPETIRHYVRLSQQNASIDASFYPLGSCTMKHNPRLGEKMARLPGFADIHPMQPQKTVQGALRLIGELAHWLKELTGMPAVAMTPKAGAHGELCGILAIRSAMKARGENRSRILVPESAHGTNPATAALCGYSVESIKATDDGHVDLTALKESLKPDVVGLMLTNPNTSGLFERDMIAIAEAVHDAGAYFYCDGANFNAIMGRIKPGDLGIDAMHINLHKTFSTPHGGGGPGAGPVVFSERLARFAPLPLFVQDTNGFRLVEDMTEARNRGVEPLGRMCAFHGQMGMFVRALAYMLSLGADGLCQAAEDAVLSANYILASLKDVMSAPYEGPCMHEALFDDAYLKDTGVTTLDVAKRLIDEGFHPITIYFPLTVHGAMLVEPTETESKATLDQFIAVMRALAMEAKNGNAADFKQAPVFAPRRRLDEAAAARKPVLRWKPVQSGGA